LIERRAGLQWSNGVDEIGDGLGLNEIDPAVKECAKRELARFGETRSQRDRLLDDLPQDNRASMRAHLDDVLTGVGMRSREVGRHDLIAVRARERRVPWLQRRVEVQQPSRDVGGGRPADAHYADPAAAGRRRNGHDGIFGGIHPSAGSCSKSLCYGLPATSQQLAFLSRYRDGLYRRVADAFGGDAGYFGNREVNEAALVRIQWSDALLGAGGFRFLREELRHLSQLVVFPATEVHAIDEQPLVPERSAERAVDDVLQRLQSFAAARKQHFGAIAGEIDPRAICSRLDLRLETEAHVFHDLHDEIGDLFLCAHG
jgi:hypothetical protein